MSAGLLSREFRLGYGESPCGCLTGSRLASRDPAGNLIRIDEPR